MKYTTTVEIAMPLDQVIELFDDHKHYDLWMEGLEKHEVLSGTFGQEGAISRLEFKLKKRQVVMEEKVIRRNLPIEYTVNYTTRGVNNLVSNKFKSIDDNRTLYSTENTFEFTGFMNIIGFIMKSAFKKQSLKYQEDFKRFAQNKALSKP